MDEELKQLLDDYYGDCRNDDQKQEIIDFITSYCDKIVQLGKDYLQENVF